MDRTALDGLFSPRSIAIVGASNDPKRIGGRPLNATIKAGFEGPIYPINPNYDEVLGRKSYPRLSDLPEAVDLVVVAVGSRYVESVIEDAAMAGARSLVVFSSGYSELGPDGRIAQDRIASLCQSNQMAMLGPNCLGVINQKAKAMASFTAALDLDLIKGGNIGFACQSGAFGSYFLTLVSRRGLGINLWVATGNEAQVSVADAIEYMADLDEISVIGGYIEGVQDCDRLRSALIKAHDAKKPVVLMKAGVTEAGARAAISHTGSMAGDDRVFSAFVEHYGGYRVSDLDEMIDLIQGISLGAYPKGKNLCLLTMSGGAGILMADAAGEADLALPSPSPEVKDHLSALVPYAALDNPVDFTGQFINDPTLGGQFLTKLSDSNLYDAFVTFVGHTALDETIATPVLETISTLSTQGGAPHFLVGLTTPPLEKLLLQAKVPFLTNPAKAVKLVRSLYEVSETLARPIESLAWQGDPHIEALFDLLVASQAGAEVVPEVASLSFFRSCGISTVMAIRATSPQEALKAAQEIGFPIVLKIDSPQVPHKAKVGGVMLSINSKRELEHACYEMMGKVARRVSGAEIRGFVVEPMVSEGLEVILGVRRDRDYGCVIMVGSGGVMTETSSDIQIRLAPITLQGAISAIERTEFGKAIQSGVLARDYDFEGLAQLMVTLSKIVVSNRRISEIDLNPVLFRQRDKDPIVLDALVVLAPEKVPS